MPPPHPVYPYRPLCGGTSEGLTAASARRQKVRSKLLAIIALTGALSVTGVGAAAAAPLSSPKHHPKPKPVTQVTGKRLATALLPGSVFGLGDTTSDLVDTGNKLIPPEGRFSSYGCGDIIFTVPLAGQTALALNTVESDNALTGVQSISQFRTNGAAWSFYGQLKAKYNSCVSFSSSISGSTQTGPIALSFDLQNVANIKVGKNYAFTVTEVVEVSDSLGDATESLNTTVVSNGTNIYTIWEFNQTSTQVPNSLLAGMISRTQALYRS